MKNTLKTTQRLNPLTAGHCTPVDTRRRRRRRQTNTFMLLSLWDWLPPPTHPRSSVPSHCVCAICQSLISMSWRPLTLKANTGACVCVVWLSAVAIRHLSNALSSEEVNTPPWIMVLLVGPTNSPMTCQPAEGHDRIIWEEMVYHGPW